MNENQKKLLREARLKLCALQDTYHPTSSMYQEILEVLATLEDWITR